MRTHENLTSKVFTAVSDREYHGEHGETLCREFEGVDPIGNAFTGGWVLRDRDGEYLDRDQYRHDIECRWRITLD